MAEKKRILTINPGSTSTKLALFEDETEVLKQELVIRAEDIADCTRMIQQLDIRMASIRDFIRGAELDLSTLDLIVARAAPSMAYTAEPT